MEEGPLRAVVAAAVLAFGGTAEAVAPSSSFALTSADFVVGAGLGLGGAWLIDRAPRPALLALAASVAWFLGTLSGASGDTLADIGAFFLLAYRGPLLTLLLVAPQGRLGGRPAAILAAGAWVAGFLPLAAARTTTAAAAGAVAAATALRSRRAAADRRRALQAAALAAVVLTAVWALAAADVGGATLLLALNDVAVALAGAVAIAAAGGAFARHAATTMAVELGPGRRPGEPVTGQLAQALADPDLQLLYAIPGHGWVDERGRPRAAPNSGRGVTRAAAPGGGEVALVHGDGGGTDPQLARSAAAAAALVLDVARLEAEVRTRAADVRTSRRRLLTVGDAERRALEQRLAEEVLGPLRRVERLLSSRRSADLEQLREGVDAAIAEVTALGHGVYPSELAGGELGNALHELAARCLVPTTTTVTGDLAPLPESHRAAAWFVCSEALANVGRHARASRARVAVEAADGVLQVSVSDDGIGGATLTRGLRGLADRVEALGGTLTLHSPAGGPTTLDVRLPL